MTFRKLMLVLLFALPASQGMSGEPEIGLPADYCEREQMDYAIAEPLCGLSGDAARGKAISSDGSRGNCLGCHQLPFRYVDAYGTIGPPLAVIGSRLS